MTRQWLMRWLMGVSLALLTASSAWAAQRDAGLARDTEFGVLVMAHGGSQQWNESVLAAVAPLRDRYNITVAFGMADAASLQSAVTELEEQGARRIGVVRLFVSGESWYERTQQILGLAPGAPQRPSPASSAEGGHAHHAQHSMEFWRIDARASFALSQEGLADALEVDSILAERARGLSRDPATEDVLILAHGPGDDAENERWIAKIASRAMAGLAPYPFRRVEVRTLREDWPEKRQDAEREVREFVQRATADHGRTLVIPFRVEGFGPYAKVLDGLDYAADGIGLLPHPNVTAWIERQVEELRLGTGKHLH